MGGLRTEQKMPDDSLSVMPYHSPDRIPVLDATKPPAYYDKILVELCDRFDIPDFKERTAKAIAVVADRRARQEAKRSQKSAENEAAKAAKNTVYNQFLSALKEKNHSVDPLLKWNNALSLGEKISVLQEFQRDANRHALNLKDDLISFGMHFLLEHISAKIP